MSKRSKKQEESVVQRMKEISVEETVAVPVTDEHDGDAQEIAGSDLIFTKAQIVIKSDDILSNKLRNSLTPVNSNTGFLCFNYPNNTNSAGMFVTAEDFTPDGWQFLLSFIESVSNSQNKIIKMRLWA